jgi:hypothetical protein
MSDVQHLGLRWPRLQLSGHFSTVPNARCRGQWHHFLNLNASKSVPGWQDDSDARVVVKKDLSIATTRTDRPSAMVSDGDNVGELPGSLCSCSAEYDELCARSASEVVQVDPGEGAPVAVAHGGTHGVDAVLVRSGVGVRVDDLSSQLHQIVLGRGQLTGRGRKRHTP